MVKPIEQEKIERFSKEVLDTFASFAQPDRKTLRYDGTACTEILRIEVITAGDSVQKRRLRELKERLKEFLPPGGYSDYHSDGRVNLTLKPYVHLTA